MVLVALARRVSSPATRLRLLTLTARSSTQQLTGTLARHVWVPARVPGGSSPPLDEAPRKSLNTPIWRARLNRVCAAAAPQRPAAADESTATNPAAIGVVITEYAAF